MKHTIKTIYILLSLFSVGFSACSPSDTSQSENISHNNAVDSTPKEYPTSYVIKAMGNTMSDMQYDMDEIRINKGKEITFTLVNEGVDEAMIHNIAIVHFGYAQDVAQRGFAHKENSYVKPNDPAVVAVSPLAQPGETVSFTFQIPERGSYQFVCTYPGHWGKMLGTLLVE